MPDLNIGMNYLICPDMTLCLSERLYDGDTDAPKQNFYLVAYPPHLVGRLADDHVYSV